MGIYILLIVYLVLCALVEKYILGSARINRKKKIIWDIIVGLPIWILVAFRGISVGTDTQMYKHLFDSFISHNLMAVLGSSTMDPGFVIICNIAGKIGLDYSGFQILIATITICLIGRFIYKYSLNFSFSWLIFVTLLFMSRSMNISREMLAVSLSLIAFDFLLQKKMAKYIIIILLTLLIHKTAILALLVCPLLFIKRKWLRYLVTIILCITVIVFFSDFMMLFIKLTGRYAHLMQSDYMNVEGGIAQYVNIIIAVFSLLLFQSTYDGYSFKIENYSMTDIWFRKSVINSYLLMGVVFAAAGFRFGLADRAALYFSAMDLFVISNGCLAQKNSMNRLIMCFGTAIILIAYFFAVLLLRNNWHSIMPYSFM